MALAAKKILTAVLCISMALGLAIYAIHRITAVSPVIAGADAPPVIVIDAGHGGFDGGATGVNDVIEKDINLAISQRLYELLTINGFEAVMTRNEDCSLEDEGLDTLRKKKNSDIHNRLALANSFPDAILLSIHQNKYTQPQYFGAQIFYGPKNQESARMAEIFQKNMVNMLDPTNIRQSKVCTNSVYLIYNASMPALLVECGFLSNPEEAQKLQSPAYQERVAFTLFSSILESFDHREYV